MQATGTAVLAVLSRPWTTSRDHDLHLVRRFFEKKIGLTDGLQEVMAECYPRFEVCLVIMHPHTCIPTSQWHSNHAAAGTTTVSCCCERSCMRTPDCAMYLQHQPTSIITATQPEAGPVLQLCQSGPLQGAKKMKYPEAKKMKYPEA